MDKIKSKSSNAKKTKSNKKKNNKKPTDIKTADKTLNDKPVWVGVGSSAGGLEALKTLVKNLPRQSNMIYIVAQHLSPEHPSMMLELLSRETDLKIYVPENNTTPKVNTMYLCPPKKDIFIKDGKITLRAPTREVGPKPSVDYLFNSLAEEMGSRAIGVVLSGTGSDGAHGMRAIKAVGGITIAQSEETAKYDGMPNAAMDTGCVDLVLAPENIGRELSNIVRYPRDLTVFKHEDEQLEGVSELIRLVKRHRSVDFKDYKRSTLNRRVERRMVARGYTQLNDYVEFAREHNNELDLLYKDVLISVTSFFRDNEAFNALRQYIHDIIGQKNVGDSIRIWIPGCATGEEAYSIAIMIAEYFSDVKKIEDYHFQIFATDLDLEALSIARKGAYPESLLEKINPKIRKKYFKLRGNNTYEIIRPIRDMIVFAHHNAIEDPPFLRLDLISCRNLLIYFNSTLQNRIMRTFHYALNSKGFLFLGKSETPSQSDNLFVDVDKKNKIYKTSLLSDGLRVAPPAFYPDKKTRKLKRKIKKAEDSINDVIVKRIIGAFAPYSIMINDNMDIRRTYGDMADLLKFPDGEISYNILKLIHIKFRQELRALIYKVLRENTAAFGQKRKIVLNGEAVQAQMTVYPLMLDEMAEKLLMVSFNVTNISNDDTQETYPIDDQRYGELERELNATKEHLQTVIEELETSNEELQSTNEELQSSNEELQSTNEEMETSNEELQSTNEELTTVNEELQMKSMELTNANSDLKNIQSSIDFALIVLDKNLQIKRFNKLSYKIFDLKSYDTGQIITSIPTHYPLPNLRTHIQKVLITGEVYTEQLDLDGESYWLRILPYLLEKGQIDGAIVTFISNGELREKERKLMASNKELQDFAYIISHDLQAPLRTITGLNERLMSLREGTVATSEKEKKFTALILESANHMRDLINMVLSYSRVATRGQDMVPLNMNDEVNFILRQFEDLVIENGIDVKLSSLPKINGDKVQIRRLMQNLIDNAIKYRCSTRKPTISISADEKKAHWVFCVEDNGIGIPANKTEEIFAIFKRLHAKDEYEGIGAGLSISKRIVQRHGGEIWVESEVNKGSKFYFTILKDLDSCVITVS